MSGKRNKKQKLIEKEQEQVPRYSFRQRTYKTIFQNHKLKEQDLNSSFIENEDQYIGSYGSRKKYYKKRKQSQKNGDNDFSGDDSFQKDGFEQKNILDRLPKGLKELDKVLNQVKSKIKVYKQDFIIQQQQLLSKTKFQNIQNSIPISTDITKFNFDLLVKKQLQFGERLFDVIMMDPPWKLSSSQPSRGVAIQYNSLGDQVIQKIPIPKLQKSGFLLIWAINAKYRLAVDLMEKLWGYKVVDSITWVKQTVNGKIAKGHGFYLQHAKQTCIVGVKGQPNYISGVASDVIFSQRRGQSQKPQQIYQYIEKLVPNGFYLEIFGRRNNLRNRWVTIGNQI